MANAEAKKKNYEEVAQTVEAANSPITNPVETAEVQMPSIDEELGKAPDRPGTFRMERMGNNGEIESWKAWPVTKEDGSRMFFMDMEGANRFVILPEDEYLAEQQMLRETEKFGRGQTWDTFTALLTDTMEDKEKQADLLQKLEQKKGRILEYAAFIALNEKLSNEEALKKVAEQTGSAIKAGRKVGRGAFELDYKSVAKALNEATRDVLMKESETESALTMEEVKNAAIIEAGFAALAVNQQSAERKALVKLDAAKVGLENEGLWNPLVRGEMIEPEDATQIRPLEEMRATLEHDLRVAMNDLKNESITVEALRENERIMLESLNLFRIASARKLATNIDDLSPAWKEFLRLSEEMKAKKGVTEKAVIPTFKPKLVSSRGRSTAKPQAAPNTELEEVSASFGIQPEQRNENAPADDHLDEMPPAFVEDTAMAKTETNIDEEEPMHGKKSPARKQPLPAVVEYEPTNPNVAPNQEPIDDQELTDIIPPEGREVDPTTGKITVRKEPKIITPAIEPEPIAQTPELAAMSADEIKIAKTNAKRAKSSPDKKYVSAGSIPIITAPDAQYRTLSEQVADINPAKFKAKEENEQFLAEYHAKLEDSRVTKKLSKISPAAEMSPVAPVEIAKDAQVESVNAPKPEQAQTKQKKAPARSYPASARVSGGSSSGLTVEKPKEKPKAKRSFFGRIADFFTGAEDAAFSE